MATEKRKTIALNPLKGIQSGVVPSQKKVEAIKSDDVASKSHAAKSRSTVSKKLSAPVGKSNPSLSAKKVVASTKQPAAKEKTGLSKQQSTKSEIKHKTRIADKARGQGSSALANEIFDLELSQITTSFDAVALNEVEQYAAGQKIIKKWSKISLATILLPSTMIEYAAISGIQLKMLHEMSAVYKIPFKADAVKVILGSILGGGVAYFLSDLYTNLLKSIPIVGRPITLISEPLIAYVTTYAVGIVFLEHFENEGSFHDIEIKQFKETIQVKMSEKYKEMIKDKAWSRYKLFPKSKKVTA